MVRMTSKELPGGTLWGLSFSLTPPKVPLSFPFPNVVSTGAGAWVGAVTEKPAFRRGCLDSGARQQQGSQGPRCFAHRVLLSLQTAPGARRRSSMASRSWRWTSSGTSAASNARPAASSSPGSTSASRSLPCPTRLTSARPQARPHMALGLSHQQHLPPFLSGCHTPATNSTPLTLGPHSVLPLSEMLLCSEHACSYPSSGLRSHTLPSELASYHLLLALPVALIGPIGFLWVGQHHLRLYT